MHPLKLHSFIFITANHYVYFTSFVATTDYHVMFIWNICSSSLKPHMIMLISLLIQKFYEFFRSSTNAFPQDIYRTKNNTFNALKTLSHSFTLWRLRFISSSFRYGMAKKGINDSIHSFEDEDNTLVDAKLF